MRAVCLHWRHMAVRLLAYVHRRLRRSRQRRCRACRVITAAIGTGAAAAAAAAAAHRRRQSPQQAAAAAAAAVSLGATGSVHQVPPIQLHALLQVYASSCQSTYCIAQKLTRRNR